MNEAYVAGFMAKCAERGVDPEALVKAAGVQEEIEPVGPIPWSDDTADLYEYGAGDADRPGRSSRGRQLGPATHRVGTYKADEDAPEQLGLPEGYKLLGDDGDGNPVLLSPDGQVMVMFHETGELQPVIQSGTKLPSKTAMNEGKDNKMNEDYVAGFMAKCAERGIDPEELAKTAARGDQLMKLIKRMRAPHLEGVGKPPAARSDYGGIKELARQLSPGDLVPSSPLATQGLGWGMVHGIQRPQVRNPELIAELAEKMRKHRYWRAHPLPRDSSYLGEKQHYRLTNLLREQPWLDATLG